MKPKSSRPSFNQILDVLRGQGFDVAAHGGVAGGFQVSRGGVGAVLDAAPAGSEHSAAVYAIAPGVLLQSELSRLVDRGYQKFMRTSQFELPASASQLQAIHAFNEELSQLIGGASLYNESLGTTSDVYRYDRPQGREAAEAAPPRPWEPATATGGH